MAIYAVGDLHGCYTTFRRLLEHIRFSDSDRLWLVGDIVNRGKHSLATLRWMHQNAERLTLTLGNHDLHLLAAVAADTTAASGSRATRNNSNDTFHDILAAKDRDILCGWLRTCPLAHYENGWLMVHAGVLPAWTLADTLALAGEAEAVIRGENWQAAAPTLYGNTPDRWDDTLSGAERLRIIVNALTRLRICTPAGQMQLAFSGSPRDIPTGHDAWFNAAARRTRETPIVCGHWSALGVHTQNNVHAIDSGCLWRGTLSALRLDNQQLFQVETAAEDQ